MEAEKQKRSLGQISRDLPRVIERALSETEQCEDHEPFSEGFGYRIYYAEIFSRPDEHIYISDATSKPDDQRDISVFCGFFQGSVIGENIKTYQENIKILGKALASDLQKII